MVWELSIVLSSLMRFRSVKTHNFRCIFAYRSHYNDRKRCPEWSLHLKTSPIVLVWTAKAEAFENADVIHIARTPQKHRMRVYLSHAQICCAVLVWTGKTLRKSIVLTRSCHFISSMSLFQRHVACLNLPWQGLSPWCVFSIKTERFENALVWTGPYFDGSKQLPIYLFFLEEKILKWAFNNNRSRRRSTIVKCSCKQSLYKINNLSVFLTRRD